ncbi:MAG: PTS sugar transporter subunit IIA [Erysipelothrix sp.]|nr:PTS sugar transporter subunit IIA [Erysipelothrix sp.]
MKNKELEILEYLIECGNTLTLDELCKKFQLNPRSIRYYMDFIMQELKDAQIELDRGTYTIKNMDVIKSFLADPHNISSLTSIKKYRMLFVFAFEESINLSHMAQELDISRVTAKQYLLEIESQLARYSLKTKFDNNGIYLIGSEESIRSVQLQILLDYHSFSEVKQRSLNDITNQYTTDYIFLPIDQFLNSIQSELKSLLTDYSYQICRNYLIIAIRRIKSQKNILFSNHLSFLSKSLEFQTINQHIQLLEDSFDIRFNQNEVEKFTDLLIGSHYSFNNEFKENTWFENNLFVTKLIANFSKYINLNLNQDHLLYDSLIAHLKPTMYRMLHNIKLSEIDTDEIMQNFAIEYDLTQRVLNELKFFTNHTADKDEIALITLHFKAAINRYHTTHSNQIRVLIVCSQGYGTSRLLEQQLNEVYSVNIVECIPSHFLPFYDNLSDIDLIVTTIKDLAIEQPIPLIYVKPILSTVDFEKLDDYLVNRKSQILLSDLTDIISEHTQIVDRKKLVESLVSRFGNTLINDLESPNLNLIKFLPSDNILIIEDEIDWQTAISLCGDMLVTNGYVNEHYVESMINAFENYGSYMVIDDGIAIPHAKNEDNVFQTGIVLTICKKPVWFNDEHRISSFFAFCSADHHEHLDALVAISNLIREPDYKQLIGTFNDEHEVIAYIRDFALRN